ncbi:MAG: hypothetical protein P8M80_18290 [Pirellulaceae bacterium]|nr:hypothetical protein [Pirellulaceae bacterium]
MSIITWVERGKKYHGVFDPRFFQKKGLNFPVFDSHRRSLDEIVSFSEDDVLLVSGDRKRFRVIANSNEVVS